MLKLDNIYKIYNEGKDNEVRALNGVSLNIGNGDMLCIKGASGAGKSTLLHILGCLDESTKGGYYIDNVCVTDLSNKAKARFRNQRIGFVLQSFALIEDESVFVNISIPLFFGRTRFFDIDGRTTEVIKRINIDHLSNRKVKNLSGGEKQRVAIARALVNNPDIILADEPTGALDTKNSEMVMDMLEVLNQEGKTVIIITHEQAVADRCKTIISMADGKIVKQEDGSLS